jgi:hypothetical protein
MDGKGVPTFAKDDFVNSAGLITTLESYGGEILVVEQVAQMTESGSEASHQASAVAQQVAGLADELRHLADLFKI